MPTDLEPPDGLDVGHVMDQDTWDNVVAARDQIEAAIAASEADRTTLPEVPDAR